MVNNMIIIGNIVSFIGAMVMIGIGLLKKKKQILIAQCVQYVIMGAGNLILGGITGGIANGVSILRNLVCMKWKFTWKWKILFIIVQVGLSLWMNGSGWLGWLPVIAAVIFTCFLDTESEIVLKLVIIGTVVLWTVYDFAIHNYTSFVFDIFTFISNIVGIVMICRSRKLSGED